MDCVSVVDDAEQRDSDDEDVLGHGDADLGLVVIFAHYDTHILPMVWCQCPCLQVFHAEVIPFLGWYFIVEEDADVLSVVEDLVMVDSDMQARVRCIFELETAEAALGLGASLQSLLLKETESSFLCQINDVVEGMLILDLFLVIQSESDCQ